MIPEHSVVCPVLVGRAAPLSTVDHTLDRAAASHGGALLISGEAGIGKSRLARAMVERASARGFVTLRGACFEADRAQPYAPLLDMIQEVTTTASPALAAHYFAPAAGELVALFPELRPLFSDLPESVGQRAEHTPEEDRRRLFHCLTEAAHDIARVQPLLLVIEDVHWSDDATLDLVFHLVRRIGSQRVAVLLTFRSDEHGPHLARLLADFDRARTASEVGLRPLGATDVAEVLEAIFGTGAGFTPDFVRELHALTEGNPFFVEEMLKALLLDGDIAHANGTWRARPLDRIRVPRTATEAVGRRLAGLTDGARDVASVAAVAGRRFDFGLLQALTTHDEATLLGFVKELVGAQLVVEESADRFAFRHALTREAIRARLLARERVALHRAIAAAIEQSHAGAAHDADDVLAYHTFEAGMWPEARRFALRAAQHALDVSAPREALQQFERAVAATVQAGRQPEPALLVARGRTHETLGAFPQANDDFLAALEAARADGDRHEEWSALHVLGMLWAARDYERAGQYRRDALDVARALGDPSLVARSLNRVGNWSVNREDPHAGIPHHEEALAIFERAADRRGVAETVDLLAMAHHMAGAQETAIRLYERSLELFTALDDRRGLANALAVLMICGPSHQTSGGPPHECAGADALLASERATKIAHEIGWRAGEAFSRLMLADCLAWRGEYARALRCARESLAIAEEIEHLEWQCGAQRMLGIIALDLFDLPEAIARLDVAHDIARRLGSTNWIRMSGAPLAIARVRSRDLPGAAAILDEMDRLVAPAPDRTRSRRTIGGGFLVLAQAELALARGDLDGAVAMITSDEAASTPRAALLRGAALAGLGRGEEAMAVMASGRETALRHGGGSLAWRFDAAIGAVHLAERRRLEARRAFDAARSAAAALVADVTDVALLTAFRAGMDDEAPPPPERTAGQAARAEFGGLTRRERDAAALIAQGKSNRAIARALGIGERTVESYVAAALAKLEFTSRAQIAVWAAEQGLVEAVRERH